MASACGIALAALVAVVRRLSCARVTRPARLAQEQARVEVTEVLPKQLRQAHADVLAVAADDAAKQKAAALLADGERAIRAGDKAAMIKPQRGTAALRDELTREYTLTIVSRTGESTGVWRRPPHGNQARNYYLIVEPLTPDGRKLSLPIRNEETGAVETVSKFGVRVPEATLRGRGAGQARRWHRAEEPVRREAARHAGRRLPDAVRGWLHHQVVRPALMWTGRQTLSSIEDAICQAARRGGPARQALALGSR